MSIGPGNCLQTTLIVETMLDNAQAQVEVQAKLGASGLIAQPHDV
jgi:hypothetical protein